MIESQQEFLINRLASKIVDASLPLKEIERELRSKVAVVAVHKRGLDKREVASRCGVTEKSIENYLKDSRFNPKSPDREIARVLQDQSLTIEETYEKVLPLLIQERSFSMDDARRVIEKLMRTGEVTELPGKRYRAESRPAIRCPLSADAYRELVDQKARDLDYIVLTQKEVRDEVITPEKMKRYSRVVGDTNLVRIDFTVDIPQEALPEFYEKLTAEMAKFTLKYEKKKGKSRIRLLIGMRSVVALLLGCLLFLAPVRIGLAEEESWELDNQPPPAADPSKDNSDSWELDKEGGGTEPGDDRTGAGGDHSPRLDLPAVFVRGDVTLDSTVDISDAVAVLRYLFLAQPVPCSDAADVDDNGAIDIADPVQILRFLFGAEPPAGSFGIGGEPAEDGTADELDCTIGLPGN